MVKSSIFPLVVGPNHQTFDTNTNYFTNDIGTAEIYFELKDEQGAVVPLGGISHVWVKAMFVQHPGSTVAASHQVHVNADIVDAGGGTVKFLVPTSFLQPPNGGRAHVLGELSLHYNNGASATAGRFTFEMTQAFAHQPLPEGMAGYFVQTFSDLHDEVVRQVDAIGPVLASRHNQALQQIESGHQQSPTSCYWPIRELCSVRSGPMRRWWNCAPKSPKSMLRT
ncbi:MAG: phage baseplate upper protein [Turicibacter sp.]|nr:phage baseplate upper protein [Turicibacter sp.]